MLRSLVDSEMCIRDRFNGAGTSTITWNNYSTGAVSTPSGNITPTDRNYCSGSASPSNGAVHTFSGAGLQRFNFTGQGWNSSYAPGGGQNWDQYALGVNGHG